MVSRQLVAPRFGSLSVFWVPFSGLWLVWLGCDGAGGLPLGIAFVVLQGLSSHMQPLWRGYPAVKVVYSVRCGCVSVCWDGACGLGVSVMLRFVYVLFMICESFLALCLLCSSSW